MANININNTNIPQNKNINSHGKFDFFLTIIIYLIYTKIKKIFSINIYNINIIHIKNNNKNDHIKTL